MGCRLFKIQILCILASLLGVLLYVQTSALAAGGFDVFRTPAIHFMFANTAEGRALMSLIVGKEIAHYSDFLKTITTSPYLELREKLTKQLTLDEFLNNHAQTQEERNALTHSAKHLFDLGIYRELVVSAQANRMELTTEILDRMVSDDLKLVSGKRIIRNRTQAYDELISLINKRSQSESTDLKTNFEAQLNDQSRNLFFDSGFNYAKSLWGTKEVEIHKVPLAWSQFFSQEYKVRMQVPPSSLSILVNAALAVTHLDLLNESSATRSQWINGSVNEGFGLDVHSVFSPFYLNDGSKSSWITNLSYLAVRLAEGPGAERLRHFDEWISDELDDHHYPWSKIQVTTYTETLSKNGQLLVGKNNIAKLPLGTEDCYAILIFSIESSKKPGLSKYYSVRPISKKFNDALLDRSRFGEQKDLFWGFENARPDFDFGVSISATEKGVRHLLP